MNESRFCRAIQNCELGRELGSEREMAHLERIIREGTGADRQLAAWERTQDTKAVVDQIVVETYEGLALP